ncbi:MAG TPA: radical SAM protein [Thermoanaerobaculia bacterium]
MPLSTADAEPYPDLPAARDRWILERRGPRARVDPSRPVGAFLEEELSETGTVTPVLTVLIANRECPWRCLMCDLWRHTTEQSVAPGAVAAQVRQALSAFPQARRAKLYNAGSFFDRRAVAPGDLLEMVPALRGLDRVIVECHPALVGTACRRFAEDLGGTLEVAMGLETVHPGALDALNKRMTLDDFRRAADRLSSWRVPFRAFVLLAAPRIPPAEAVAWSTRSVEFAFGCGASAVTILPTRPGNGALDVLVRRGEFTPATLDELERALGDAILMRRGRVFADLWDLDRLRDCGDCFPIRRARLAAMNRMQTVPPAGSCGSCGHAAGPP